MEFNLIGGCRAQQSKTSVVLNDALESLFPFIMVMEVWFQLVKFIIHAELDTKYITSLSLRVHTFLTGISVAEIICSKL